MADTKTEVTPECRVRLEVDTKPEDVRDGTGTVVRVSQTAAIVWWDGHERMLLSPAAIEALIVVPVSCSYEQTNWKRGKKWGIDGMVIVCDVHGYPANPDVYEVDPGQERTVKAWCLGVVKP